jgi:hypothetical protein
MMTDNTKLYQVAVPYQETCTGPVYYEIKAPSMEVAEASFRSVDSYQYYQDTVIDGSSNYQEFTDEYDITCLDETD